MTALERVRASLRTSRVLGGALWDMARSDPGDDSTTVAGLERVRATLAPRLEQLHLQLHVTGASRVPREGGLVFMWNQTSHLDHLVLPFAIPRPFHTTYNNEVRRFPIYGKRLARSDHFWLDRNDEAQWRSQVAAAAARIAAGACVLISPEGTRSRDGRLLPMKRGAFLLARAARRPIVCVIVRGAHERLPRGSFAVRPGTIEIELAEPIGVDDATDPRLEDLVAATLGRASA